MNRGVVGVILAGGQSKRMSGRDKPLICLAGRPLIAHVIEHLKKALDTIIISANGDPARFARFGLPVVADTVEGHQGPLAGLLAGMEWTAAHSTASNIVAVAADTPFFSDAYVSLLIRRQVRSPGRVVIAADNDDALHPTFGLWPLALRHGLADHLASGGSRKMIDWARRHDCVTEHFPPHLLGGRTVEPFFNINTPDDLAEAEDILQNQIK